MSVSYHFNKCENCCEKSYITSIMIELDDHMVSYLFFNYGKTLLSLSIVILIQVYCSVFFLKKKSLLMYGGA